MTRAGAQKGLFISIAVAVVLFILRDPLAEIADDNLGFGYDFFEQRWALALAALAIVYFAYRLASAPPPNSK